MSGNSKLERTIQKERKGKAGKYCPVRNLDIEGHERKCGDYCAWFCIGLNSCVLHGINNNLKELRDKKENPKA